MNYNRVVCFDLEMCCWNENGVGTTGEIIEIGLAEIDLAAGEIVKRAQYFVKPEKDEISLFCAELTGITPRKIEKQGRPLAEVIQSMVKTSVVRIKFTPHGGAMTSFCLTSVEKRAFLFRSKSF